MDQNSSLPFDIGTHRSFECPHNKRFYKVKGGGILRGYSGTAHQAAIRESKEDLGIHVFLTDTNMPICYTYSNCRELLPKMKPDERIVYYHINDRQTPVSKGEFKGLMQFLTKQLRHGDNVLVSCMGGHGRTGLVLAVLYGMLTGSKDPVKEMRKWHCDRAVETYGQHVFVHEMLGLPIPEEEIEPCSKCKKNKRWKRPDGRLDIWCEECDKEWRERQKKNENTRSTVSAIESHSVATSDKYCTKCYVRKAHVLADICAQCIAMEEQGTAPEEKDLEKLVERWTTMANGVFLNRTRAQNEVIIRSILAKNSYHALSDEEFGMLGALDWPDELCQF